jgi:hypothetical protein
MLSSSDLIGLPADRFPRDFLTKILYAFVVFLAIHLTHVSNSYTKRYGMWTNRIIRRIFRTHSTVFARCLNFCTNKFFTYVIRFYPSVILFAFPDGALYLEQNKKAMGTMYSLVSADCGLEKHQTNIYLYKFYLITPAFPF